MTNKAKTALQMVTTSKLTLRDRTTAPTPFGSTSYTMLHNIPISPYQNIYLAKMHIYLASKKFFYAKEVWEDGVKRYYIKTKRNTSYMQTL